MYVYVNWEYFFVVAWTELVMVLARTYTRIHSAPDMVGLTWLKYVRGRQVYECACPSHDHHDARWEGV